MAVHPFIADILRPFAPSMDDYLAPMEHVSAPLGRVLESIAYPDQSGVSDDDPGVLYWSEGDQVATWNGSNGPERLTVDQATRRLGIHQSRLDRGEAELPEATQRLIDELARAIREASSFQQNDRRTA